MVSRWTHAAEATDGVIRAASSAEHEEIIGSDAATRALVGHASSRTISSRGVYEKLASVYDFTFGPTLHPGRVQAIQRMGIKPGDRVLEVGVGTGINAALYPRDCSVTGIDLSSSMLEKARERVARKGVRNVRLLEMDAADLKFADDSFDIVYAPYRHQRRARSGRRRARDAPRLPSRRPHHHPQPLPQPEPRSVAWLERADLAVHAFTSASSRISICRRSSRRPS